MLFKMGVANCCPNLRVRLPIEQSFSRVFFGPTLANTHANTGLTLVAHPSLRAHEALPRVHARLRVRALGDAAHVVLLVLAQHRVGPVRTLDVVGQELGGGGERSALGGR